VEIEWTAEKGERFLVKLYTRGTDRRGLLSDIAKAISDTGTNIQHADVRAAHNGMLGQFVVEVRDLSHLKKVMSGVGQVKGVLAVERRESLRDSELLNLEGG
jgi:GTP pyrophosphokinase